MRPYATAPAPVHAALCGPMRPDAALSAPRASAPKLYFCASSTKLSTKTNLTTNSSSNTTTNKNTNTSTNTKTT